jgi:transcriptional adapter 3
LRDSIDKNISAVYTKLQKKDGPKARKNKKKSLDINGAEPPPPPTPCPAALGLGPDDDNRLVVPEQLKQLVQTRAQWVETVGGVFEAKQREEPGRIWGFPMKSVFEGIDEQLREPDGSALRTSTSNGTRVEDGMDVR